jgi:biopolymer transport protein ExbD
MAMTIGTGGGTRAEINMTPMIDVLLVLIIIFMVITPLTPKGLEALVPQPPPPGQKANESDMRTVVITIDAKHNLAVNSEPIDEARLGTRLEEIFKTRAERVVFVKGEGSIDFQYVARAIDIAHGAGIDKVGLMTAKVEAGQ